MTTTLLKRIFLVDAATCLAVFLLGLFDGAPLARLTGLPEAAIAGGAWICLATALFLGWLGTRERPPVALCWAIVAGNLGWVAANMATIAMTQGQITAFGTMFVTAQAIGVLVLTAFEAAGTRSLAARPAQA